MKKRSLLFLTLSIFFIGFDLPVAAKTIVDTSNTYTYEEMIADIEELKNMYPETIEYKTIGKTNFNRDILAVKVGKGESNILISGSTHAREWITTVLTMKMIEEYSRSYLNDETIEDVRVRDLLNETSIWFVPMINPDGVTLQQKGLSAFPKSYHTALLNMNNGSYDFRRWKSNAEGIDLNRNYPPAWNDSSSVKEPYWKEYKGQSAFQTKETSAMRDFTYEVRPKNVIAYHSSGRVLYWINKDDRAEDYPTVQQFSRITKYPMKKHLPYRGYTEWFVQEFGGIGFTPELAVSVGDREVPLSAFPSIWDRNKTIGIWLGAETYTNNLQPPEPSAKKIILDEEFLTYSKPSFFDIDKTIIKPGTYAVTEEINNWYRIVTPFGEKWILHPNKVIEPTEVKIKPTEEKDTKFSLSKKMSSSIDYLKLNSHKKLILIKEQITSTWEGIPYKFKVALFVVGSEIVFVILYISLVRKYFNFNKEKHS
ncbi:M14 family zinc carboxypeptidase (plasmid) [Rossellomorea sp. AcN35-11]|nr:gamma-D-glutamyl-meso-diaminopimelate peptidase [Rossellomorea aquimaris]WJV32327.1 M14 family zinc carboxypeptidase [Rossellomorea sp. AcN35-11]